jgi:hypothetical protein
LCPRYGNRGPAPDLSHDPRSELTRGLPWSNGSLGRREEAHTEPRSPREPCHLHPSAHCGAHEVSLRNGESQSSGTASGAKPAPSRHRPFGKDTDAGTGRQLSGCHSDRVRVALPAVDRYLPHRVEHPAEHSVPPQGTPGQRANLPLLADGRSDDQRIPCAVVIRDQQRGSRARQRRSPHDPKTSPAAQNRPDGCHRGTVGARHAPLDRRPAAHTRTRMPNGHGPQHAVISPVNMPSPAAGSGIAMDRQQAKWGTKCSPLLGPRRLL